MANVEANYIFSPAIFQDIEEQGDELTSDLDVDVEPVPEAYPKSLNLAAINEAINQHIVCQHMGSNAANWRTLQSTLTTSLIPVEINDHLTTGQTPLLVAIQLRHYRAVTMLIRQGADVNLKGSVFEPDAAQPGLLRSSWRSPASLAVKRHAPIQSIVRQLKDTPNNTVEVDANKWKDMWELCERCRSETELTLLAQKCLITGWNKDIKDKYIEDILLHALYDAVREGYGQASTYLLDRGVNPNGYLESKFMVPLTAAALAGKKAMCELLITRGVRLNSNHKFDPVVQAVCHGNAEAVNMLVTLGCRCNPCEPIGIRLEVGSRVAWLANMFREWQWQADDRAETTTLLHCAAALGHLSVVRLLVEKYGANIQTVNSSGLTALHSAALADQTQVMALLLAMCSEGGDVDTATYMAMKTCSKLTTLACFLLPIDPLNINEKINGLQVLLDRQLDLKSESKETCCKLIEFIIEGKRPDLIDVCIRHGLDVVYLNEAGTLGSPLEQAIHCLPTNDVLAMAKALLVAGADATKLLNDKNALHVVAATQHRGTVVTQLFDLLTEAGADWGHVETYDRMWLSNVGGLYAGSVLHTALRGGQDRNCIQYCISKCLQLINIPLLYTSSVLKVTLEAFSDDKLAICGDLLAAGAKLDTLFNIADNRQQRHGHLRSFVFCYCLCSKFAVGLLVAAGCAVFPEESYGDDSRRRCVEMAVAVDMRWLLLLFLAGEDSASVRRLLDTDDLADHADNMADVADENHNENENGTPDAAGARALLVSFATNPPRLSHLSRRAIRQRLVEHSAGTSIIPLAFTLPLPPSVQQYILLSDVRECSIDSCPPHYSQFKVAPTGCSSSHMWCTPDVAETNVQTNRCCHHPCLDVNITEDLARALQ